MPLKPFMGIMGAAPANPSEAKNSVPPGKRGGNVDVKHLGIGSSLYLPVQVPGALFTPATLTVPKAMGKWP